MAGTVDAGIEQAADTLGFAVGFSLAPTLCDLDVFEAPEEIRVAVEAALSSGTQGDREAALQLIRAAITRVVAGRGESPVIHAASGGRFALAGDAWSDVQPLRPATGAENYPATREFLYLAASAQLLGDETVANEALAAAEEAFIGEAEDRLNELADAEASDQSVKDYLDIAANAQLLGLEELGSEAMERAIAAHEAVMRDALKQTDPCNGSLDGIKQLLTLVAKSQLLTADSDAGSELFAAAQEQVRSVARKTAAGADTGLSASQSTALGQAMGLDAEVGDTEWFEEDACRDNWVLDVSYESAFPGSSIVLLGHGVLDISIADDGTYDSEAVASFSVGGTIEECTVALEFTPPTYRVTGRRVLDDYTIALTGDLEVISGGAFTVVLTCRGQTISQPGVQDSGSAFFAFTLTAEDGAQEVFPATGPGPATLTFMLVAA